MSLSEPPWEVTDEIRAIGHDDEGEIVLERVENTDGTTSASLSTDAGKPSNLRVSRTQRVLGFDDESAFAQTFVKAFNASHGTSFTVKAKEKEDSNYADRLLFSVSDSREFTLQIRYMDDKLIADLGRGGSFHGTRSHAEHTNAINRAIEAKALIDPRVKAQTVLLLVNPAALGQMTRDQLLSTAFDQKGFLEVWIAPFHEEPFRLVGEADL